MSVINLGSILPRIKKRNIMNLEKQNMKLSSAEDKINQFIKRRKEENSALKKLLSALESAKKDASGSKRVS